MDKVDDLIEYYMTFERESLKDMANKSFCKIDPEMEKSSLAKLMADGEVKRQEKLFERFKEFLKK